MYVYSYACVYGVCVWCICVCVYMCMQACPRVFVFLYLYIDTIWVNIFIGWSPSPAIYIFCGQSPLCSQYGHISVHLDFGRPLRPTAPVRKRRMQLVSFSFLAQCYTAAHFCFIFLQFAISVTRYRCHHLHDTLDAYYAIVLSLGITYSFVLQQNDVWPEGWIHDDDIREHCWIQDTRIVDNSFVDQPYLANSIAAIRARHQSMSLHVFRHTDITSTVNAFPKRRLHNHDTRLHNAETRHPALSRTHAWRVVAFTVPQAKHDLYSCMHDVDPLLFICVHIHDSRICSQNELQEPTEEMAYIFRNTIFIQPSKHALTHTHSYAIRNSPFNVALSLYILYICNKFYPVRIQTHQHTNGG